MYEISPEDLRSLLIETDALAEKLEAAERELAEKQATSALSPTELAALVGRFLFGLDSQLPGMKLSDGELHLRVGSEKTAQGKSFVVPSPDGSRYDLQEVSVRILGDP